MSTFTNKTKSTVATCTNASKHLATWYSPKKGGQGWQYNEPSITYDGPLDSLSHNRIFYNSVGTLPVWSNMAKH